MTWCTFTIIYVWENVNWEEIDMTDSTFKISCYKIPKKIASLWLKIWYSKETWHSKKEFMPLKLNFEKLYSNIFQAWVLKCKIFLLMLVMLKMLRLKKDHEIPHAQTIRVKQWERGKPDWIWIWWFYWFNFQLQNIW